ncbi:MAG: oligosaccharide flippase family protein [Candidatus Competibacteraceae bacterium]|nr:oligosaccharide flippase family protein [Candidatus Competibacteraceae bacterium]
MDNSTWTWRFARNHCCCYKYPYCSFLWRISNKRYHVGFSCKLYGDTFLSQPNAWLTREMKFGTLAAIRFSGSISNAVCAISLAWSDFGPISLAWANLSTTVVGILVTAAMMDTHLPKTPILSGIGQVFAFGGKITTISLLRSFAHGCPELFLGKLQSITDAGLFSRGQGLVSMFERLVVDAVNAVALPFFAKQNRQGHDIGKSFLEATALITVLGWSFLSCLGILTFPTTRLLYGAQWDSIVEPTRWLSIAMAFAIPAIICIPPLLVCGHITQVLIVTMLSTIVQVVCTGLGAMMGLLELSQMLILAAALSTTLWLILAKKTMAFLWRDLIKILVHSASVAVASSSLPFVISLILGWRSPDVFKTLLLSVPSAILGFLLAVWLAQHPIYSEMKRIFDVLKIHLMIEYYMIVNSNRYLFA